MKNFSILLLMLFGFITVFAQSGNIEVAVANINVEEGGMINIAVYGKDGFLKSGKAVKETSVKVTGDEVKATFTDIPADTYGIAVYHDENSDGKLNTNFIGIPKEPVGFSNDAVGKMGPPSFEQTSFAVETGKTIRLTVNMK